MVYFSLVGPCGWGTVDGRTDGQTDRSAGWLAGWLPRLPADQMIAPPAWSTAVVLPSLLLHMRLLQLLNLSCMFTEPTRLYRLEYTILVPASGHNLSSASIQNVQYCSHMLTTLYQSDLNRFDWVKPS